MVYSKIYALCLQLLEVKALTNLSLFCLGFISGKLSLTLDSGHIFVEYTYVVAVVYILRMFVMVIYTDFQICKLTSITIQLNRQQYVYIHNNYVHTIFRMIRYIIDCIIYMYIHIS